MEVRHAPNWIEASSMLREAMEQYRDQNYYPSLPRVIDDLIKYIKKYSGKWLSEKTFKRDAGNISDSKKIYRIPNWRIRIYAKWIYEKVGKERKWIAAWLDTTGFSTPGRLLAEISDFNGDNDSTSVKTNVPSLKTRLWGRFLGREEEFQRLRQWADHQRYPIAVLYGFGGNGKTTIQQKAGEEFVHGAKCSLRWPFDGAVWVSAADYLKGQPALIDVLCDIIETFAIYPSINKTELRTIPLKSLKEDVTKLLEKLRILVLLDNFETVSKSNQVEILQFFNNIRGSSQVLISTRYRPDWFLEQDSEDMYRMAHVLIRVDGLSATDSKTLIQEFLTTKALSSRTLEEKDFVRLTEITQNNPKAILVLLGLIEQGVSLSQLLNTMTSGTADADHVYNIIIDYTWKEMLSNDEKAVLMAKAFFSHSVSETDLGQIAGVDGDRLQSAIKTLATISFFETEGSGQQGIRIRTHALAQEFAKRVFYDHPDLKKEIEERWWAGYGPKVIDKAGKTPYKSLQLNQQKDVANVLEHLEHHIHESSPYHRQALMLFGGNGGLGHILLSWSRFDDILRFAESIMESIVNEEDAAIIGKCCLYIMVPTYLGLGRFEEAERWIGLAVEQNTRLKDRWLEAAIEGSRGYLHSYQGYLLAGEQAYQKALAIFIEMGSIPDIIKMYKKLGSLYICIATHDLKDAIDTSGKSEHDLIKAEHYYKQAEALFTKERPDSKSLYEPLEFNVERSIISRLRGGDLSQARKILQICIENARWSSTMANLYCELALVEHLTGNIDLAHSYEKKGTNVLRQLGVVHVSKNSIFKQCRKVIDRMKQEGTW